LAVSTTLVNGSFTAGNGALLSNYSLPIGSVAGNVGVITPAPLSVSLVGGAVSKVYDGGDAATLAGANYQLSGLVGSQSISVSQTAASYASPNVGTGLAVNATLLNGSFTAGNGTLLSNYALPTGSVAGTIGVITPAPLSVSLLSGAVSRAYDGAGDASIGAAAYQISGLVSNQSITVAPTTGSYASNNVGTGIGVTTTLIGGDFTAGASTLLSNYTLPVGVLTGNAGVITPALLTATLTGSASKVYDGGDVATLAGANYLLSGLVGSQSISVSPTAGSYASPNVGTGLAVNATLVNGNFTAGNGTLLSNYALPIGSVAGNVGVIMPASLTVIGTTVGSSVYTGTIAASLTGGTLAGVVNGDTVSLSQAGTYASKNAGSGIAVTAADGLGGASAGDYRITQPVGLTGTITPASLTVTGTTVSNSVYNGTTAASLTGGTLIGVVNGDTVSLVQAGFYATKNPGSGIAVTAADVLSGASANDYSITQPVGLTGAITPDHLSVVGTMVDSKVYNGTSSATLSGGTLVGVVAGDMVTLIQAGTFASTNAGSGIPVTVTDSLSGANAIDYSITQPTGLTGTISPATPLPTPTPSPSAPARVAQTAATQVQSSFASPQLGSSPQAISASPTIVAMSAPSGEATASSPTTPTAASAGAAASTTTDSLTASSTTDGSSATSGSSASGGSSANSATAANGDSSTAVPEKATAVNVSMKIGATGTLTIQRGGLRLPDNLTVDKQ
jgi:hypothetical protein